MFVAELRWGGCSVDLVHLGSGSAEEVGRGTRLSHRVSFMEVSEDILFKVLNG